MHRIVRLSLLIAAMLTFAACSLPRGAAVQNEIIRTRGQEDPGFSVVAVTRDNVAALSDWPATGWSGSYRWPSTSRGPASPLIRTGDRIDMVIWDNQDNSLLTAPTQKNVTMSGLTVSPSGTIFVPYVDEVVVRGMTPADARRKVQQNLEMIVPSAQVQLSVASGLGNSVDAVRGFTAPGSYPLPGRNYTVLNLISAAGGIASGLQNPLVRLIRDGQTYQIRADVLLGSADRNITLRGGDKLIVEEDDRYFVALGATGSEELVYFTKEHVTAIEALALLGGLSDQRANPEGVLILREYSGNDIRTDGSGPDRSEVVFTFDLTTADGLFSARNFQVNPKDLVVATESPVNAARTVFGIIGSIVGLSNSVNNVTN